MNESRKDTQTEGENTNYHKQLIGNKSREKQVELLEVKILTCLTDRSLKQIFSRN